MTRPSATKRPASPLAGRVVGSVLLFALGAWPIVTQEARFRLGGRRGSGQGAIDVAAAGIDAVAIGCFGIGLGLVNLALGMKGPVRRKVFWAGASLIAAVLLLGAFRALQGIASLFGS